ncbi:bifunctional serine/threonine-protein kinase/formylglycine-generating enzyme family protein [Simiduia aestuariiviva]|uniref:Formylglycine-generating enzyme required for sulfatase activity/serine/threonine protein kinase n=1 Tax=Simiduia aestuariiviva TaxID=1510459 RepID=A0A839UNB3_9GAMM|nr:bifunctional serine/threonine-protein kinase/formylglycine-generating enzyme family protein [Simiduia aestuariiviva]MBB3168030.1 formylglycine-generating enzyme required for sulfatase activity/serine/threonine protein kinase [Simiduia aestuariiviva]
MNREHALQALGLDASADQATIDQAISTKRSQIQQKHDAAPTDALKAKFAQMLAQLNEAEALLTSPATPKPKKPSPLSQTKLADLPGMGAAAENHALLTEGQTLAGRYQIKAHIGAGGMGAVYRAFDQSMGRDIALKVLLPELFKNEHARERFLNEARISQQLSHPNIVNVFDVQNEGDVFFLTMELLEGQDLRQLMENRKLTRQPFTVAEVQEIATAIGAALTYAHKFTIHRDLKPENIWLTEEGDYKLMDFGIAQVQSTSQRTQTGAAMGTAYYMAPEQLKGQKDIDGRADQYALAVLMYELLSGEVPAGRIEPLCDIDKTIPKAISAIVDKGLAARPENRFASVAEFVAAITQAKAPKASKTKSKNYSTASAQSNWPMITGVVALLVLGGGLFGTGLVTVEDVKKLLPVSKEVIAEQKAQVARVQGEIKVLKQRLENGRRTLDSDIRDAERNKDKNLTALSQWQQLTESVIFGGNHITELEGELSMAESLLRESALAQAQVSVDKVRDGYQQLWDNFVAGEQVSILSPIVAGLRREWQSKPNSKTWPVSQNTEALYQKAQQHESSGQLHSAQPLLEQLGKGYRALLAANDDMGSINNALHQAQTDWKKLANSKQLVNVPEIISLQTEEKTHRSALAAAADLVAITQAMQGLKGQIETYQSLTASVQNLAQAEKSAQSAQAAFKKSRQGYPFPVNAMATKAAEIFMKARTDLQSKNWVAAGKGFVEAKQIFEQAQQQEAKERLAIDAARAAQQQAIKAQVAYQKAQQAFNRLTENPDADIARKQQASADQQLESNHWSEAKASYAAAVQTYGAALKRVQSAETEYQAKMEAERVRAWVALAVGQLVAIPAGSFRMGSSGFLDANDEKPAHSVTIKAFKMQVHEVTWAQWDACVAAKGCSYKSEDEGWGRGSRPMINVSYEEITSQFIPWLNKAAGQRFRLPTEAEWEYAARAGSSTDYPWGNSISCSQARYRNQDGDCGNDLKTVPVKSYQPNGFGLYDMHGNVWEWVQDCWHDSYSGAPTDGSAWLSGNCSRRVLRGGSWGSGPKHLRSPYRLGLPASNRLNDGGFRLVQEN